MEYISADMLFWQSPQYMRERAGEKKEGGREGGKRGKKERERRINNLFTFPSSCPPYMYWKTFDLSEAPGHWSCDRCEMTAWLQRVKIYPIVYQVWYTLELSLLCPTGVNANRIIYREAGLDTGKLDFDSCSYFTP